MVGVAVVVLHLRSWLELGGEGKRRREKRVGGCVKCTIDSCLLQHCKESASQHGQEHVCNGRASDKARELEDSPTAGESRWVGAMEKSMA